MLCTRQKSEPPKIGGISQCFFYSAEVMLAASQTVFMKSYFRQMSQLMNEWINECTYILCTLVPAWVGWALYPVWRVGSGLQGCNVEENVEIKISQFLWSLSDDFRGDLCIYSRVRDHISIVCKPYLQSFKNQNWIHFNYTGIRIWKFRGFVSKTGSGFSNIKFAHLHDRATWVLGSVSIVFMNPLTQ
jgi:hypothetical protein